eukprot:jgi/Undpi1/5413/HiC_scaffold_2.g00694.m1
MVAQGWEAWGPASASAACVVRGVSAVLSGKCVNALCLVETLGMHAASGGCSGEDEGGGQAGLDKRPCSVNSVAVGALYAHLQWSVGRVAVVDFGAHLATGTADILCRTLDPTFLYASIAVSDGDDANTGTVAHEHALRLTRKDDNKRRAITTTTTPPTADKNGALLTRRRLDGGGVGGGGGSCGGALTVLSSALEGFRPDLVMISAGLDGRKGHPCGRGDLVAEDYEWLTREVVKLSERLCCGRVVSVSERRCQAAKSDAQAHMDNATATTVTSTSAGAAVSTTSGPASASARGAVDSGHISISISSGSGSSDVVGAGGELGGGGEGKHKLKPPAGASEEGVVQEKGAREEGGSKGKGLELCSELDCLKGHIRGLCSTVRDKY